MNPVSRTSTASLNVSAPDFSQPTDEHDTTPGYFLTARLREVIEAHLDDTNLCSGNLHRFVPTSRATLHRLLHKYAGQSTSSYLSHYRIQRSLQFLGDCRQSISEVAAKVGMNSPAYTRAFRAAFGHTPSDFRNLWWADDCYKFETIGNFLKQ